MTALPLTIIPPEAADAREVYTFRVAEGLIREMSASARRVGIPSLVPSPEESIRRLGADMVEPRLEDFRAGAHADLPASWVHTEVSLLRSPAEPHTDVLVALTVERPELDGVWILGQGGGPVLAMRAPVDSESAWYGYAVEDGREVYGPAVPF